MKQKIPDTFSVPVKIQINKPNLNTRYKNFRQIHYTCGDEEQFEHLVQPCAPGQEFRNEKDDQEHNHVLDVWKDFSLQNAYVLTTFKYLFHKFKKGIFIQIRHGQVHFTPFSNAYFINEWFSKIQNYDDVLHAEKNLLPVRKWYSNNGLLRFENPCNETDTGFTQVKHMFETLTKEHPSIPDMDFFVNRRDFPLLKRNRTEPYENIWDSENQPLISHNYEKYIPLLSYTTSEQFADIPIPTMDDWNRVMQKEGRYFASTKRSVIYNDSFDTPWKKKKSLAVFRGTATGIGLNSLTNPRIKLCEQFGDNPLFDVGITNPNTRFRKAMGTGHIQKADTSNCRIKQPLTIEEQSKYKYIVHVEGHSQAFRLSIELATGSVILLVKSKYKLWFENLLVPWVHYVPVEPDLSDLEAQVHWCRNNDDKCAEIARQARCFYEEHLGKKGMLNYLYDVMWNIWHKTYRDEQVTHPKHTNRYIEGMYLKKLNPLRPKNVQNGVSETFRTYMVLQKLVHEPRCYSKVIFRNQSTTVFLCNQGEKKWIRKTVLHKDFRHEAFVGIYGINKVLMYIPNFCYTLPSYTPKSSEIFLEFIQGDTLFDYIKSNFFRVDTWLFIMIQLLLAVGVAQRICFFTHNDLCPWNIILYPLKSNEQKTYDYVLGINDIYRVETDVIPVILDYDKSHIIHELQSFSLYKGFDSFQDCLCLIVSCIWNIIKYHEDKLSVRERNTLLQIVKETLCDDIYCPEDEIRNFSDLKIFLEESHKYANISFSHKGNLSKKKPGDIIPVFHKYISRKNSVQRVEYAEQNNLGGFIPQPNVPNHRIHTYLERYLSQKSNTGILNRVGNFDLAYPMLDVNTKDEIVPIQYLEHMNIFVDLYSTGGKYKLSEDERKILLESITAFMETRKFIYDYAVGRMFLKIQRNIF